MRLLQLTYATVIIFFNFSGCFCWDESDRTDEELKLGIAGFYDRSSALWEDVWGEHMHHGYYIPENRTDHIQAQIDLIDEVLEWAGVHGASDMVDVGCGIGGSSRHIAKKFGCKANGITLSPYQANRANELAEIQGLSDQASFQVADAFNMPFPDNSFDLVWSLESGEHMPDKRKFVDELMRVAAPGARVIIVTWVHRDLAEDEELRKSEERLLKSVNRIYFLPKWCSTKDYIDILEEKGALDIKSDDWSYIIAPFWKAVIRSSMNLKSVVGLIKSGWSTIQGAYAMFLMLRGYKMGTIKFGVMAFTKPLTEDIKNEAKSIGEVSDEPVEPEETEIEEVISAEEIDSEDAKEEKEEL